MSTISKVFTVVNIVLALFLLGSVAAILSESKDYRDLYENEKNEREIQVAELEKNANDARESRQAFEDENRNLVNQKSNLDDEIIRLTADAQDKDRENNELRGQVSGLNDSYQGLTAQLNAASARRDQLETDNDDLRGERDAAAAAKLAAENDRTRFERDVERLESDVADFETRLTAVTERRDVLEAEQVALESVGVPIRQLIGNNVPPIDGLVSDVGTGFVVLSVGETDGVKIGYPFDIYRDGNYVGRVVVNRVYPDNCIARVMMKNEGVDFSTNDKAATRL